jgi:hypothetical protein
MTTSLPGTNLNPLDSPSTHNAIAIGGRSWPLTDQGGGYVKIVGAGAPRVLDIRAGHGQTGATVLYKGETLSEFSIDFYLVETSDWDEWFDFRPVLAKPPVGAAAKALPVYHPYLATLGIDAILVMDEGQPEEVDETGLHKVSVKVVQWKKPTPTIGLPKGASQTEFPTPQTAGEKKLQQLGAEYDNLAGQ